MKKKIMMFAMAAAMLPAFAMVGFIAAGAARWFDGDVQTWSYQPIREAARAADEIVRLLLLRHPNR